MTSIKLEEKSIELNGRTYVLHINMSVLDRILTACDGNLDNLLRMSVYDSTAVTMAAMLNDCAEDQGWEEDWTPKKVKKIFTASMMNMLDVTGMFFRAMSPAGLPKIEAKTEEKKPDESSGN